MTIDDSKSESASNLVLQLDMKAVEFLSAWFNSAIESNGLFPDVMSCLGYSAVETVQHTQSALAQLKLVRNTLEVAAKSIDISIQKLNQRTETTIRAAGLATLPDELLARIFEFASAEHWVWLGTEGGKKSSTVLASVCRRFRHIALRVPALWEIVCHNYSQNHIKMQNSRARNPRVYIHEIDDLEDSMQISNFVKNLHPSQQWRELDICYSYVADGELALKGINSIVNRPFKDLHFLTITNLAEDEFNVHALPHTLLTESSQLILRSWEFPSLSTITLENVIPERLYCPMLESFKLTLNQHAKWDFVAFKWLLSSLTSLAYLFVTFVNVEPLTEDIGSLHEVTLPGLTHLFIDIQGETSPSSLDLFGKVLDMPRLKKLELGMTFTSENAKNHILYIDALFRESPLALRVYPNVKEFSIVSESKGPTCSLSYPIIFSALPNVEELSLSLSGVQGPHLYQIRDKSDNLRRLRRLRLRNCGTVDKSCLRRFFELENQRDRLQSFEIFEVENIHWLTEEKKKLDELLGDKMIWKA